LKTRTVSPPSLAPSERARLLALVDAVPLPLPTLHAGELITGPPELLAALEYYDGLWLASWRAWQRDAIPQPLPQIGAEIATPCYGDVWLAGPDAVHLIERLTELAQGKEGE
jgi:hypothetical protein